MFANILAVALAAAPAAAGGDVFAPPTGTAGEALALLAKAGDAPDEELPAAVERAIELLSPHGPAGEALQRAVAAHHAGGADADPPLREALRVVHAELSFQPLREAELPEGFPTYTPAGAIEVKTYPKHRRAVAKQFFTLFAHITGNQIAMTAPVRMEFKPADDGRLEQESMAFYYGNPEIGQVGRQGPVETVDDDGETVVALGYRGDLRKGAIDDGRQRLLRWLKDHPEYEAAGDLVVMGYNSPMVPDARSFMEVQLPIRKTAR